MDRGVWWAAVHGVAKSRTRLSNFTFMFHFHALEKEMAPHSSTLAWKIPGTAEPGGLLSMGSHRVGHDWSDLATADYIRSYKLHFHPYNHVNDYPNVLVCKFYCTFQSLNISTFFKKKKILRLLFLIVLGKPIFKKELYMSQSRLDALYWTLGAGALGWPRGMVWGGRREEGSG